MEYAGRSKGKHHGFERLHNTKIASPIRQPYWLSAFRSSPTQEARVDTGSYTRPSGDCTLLHCPVHTPECQVYIILIHGQIFRIGRSEESLALHAGKRSGPQVKRRAMVCQTAPYTPWLPAGPNRGLPDRDRHSLGAINRMRQSKPRPLVAGRNSSSRSSDTNASPS